MITVTSLQSSNTLSDVCCVCSAPSVAYNCSQLAPALTLGVGVLVLSLGVLSDIFRICQTPLRSRGALPGVAVLLVWKGLLVTQLMI